MEAARLLGRAPESLHTSYSRMGDLTSTADSQSVCSFHGSFQGRGRARAGHRGSRPPVRDVQAAAVGGQGRAACLAGHGELLPRSFCRAASAAHGAFVPEGGAGAPLQAGGGPEEGRAGGDDVHKLLTMQDLTVLWGGGDAGG